MTVGSGAVVVVGWIGAHSTDALRWAAHEASLRRCTLVVCHAYDELAERCRAEALVDAAMQSAGAYEPGLDAIGWVASGEPADVLADAVATHAADPAHSVLVVGCRTGGLAAALHHDPAGPVVVVARRPKGSPAAFGGQVVAAAPDEPDASAVVDFAAGEAGLRSVELTLIRAAEDTDEQWKALDELAAPHRGEVEVGVGVYGGEPLPGMLAAAEGAALLVAPVSQASHELLAGADCAVAVVPPPAPVAPERAARGSRVATR